MQIIDMTPRDTDAPEQVSTAIFTIPNLISFIRLCLIPVFLILLFQGHDLASALIFALTAATDFFDGYIARATQSVSRLGQFLDPAVDRLLVIAVVIGLLVVGRLPLWITIVVLARDLLLLVGGAILLQRYHVRVAVIYLGKIATTLFFVGCAGLLLNAPLLPGLGLVDLQWLPGFTAGAVCWGIWFIYGGLALIVITTSYYLIKAFQGIVRAKAAIQVEGATDGFVR